jgi:uncharacterized circularly permuted ATP-grasp superfamily protein
MKRLDEDGPSQLVRTAEPVNRFPDFVRVLVAELRAVVPTAGKVRIAQLLARAGLHLAPTTVRRMLEQRPMLVGPKATKAECAEFARRIRAAPRNYIAQPLIELSTCPTWTPRGLGPRRVDWRPYVVTGKDSWVLPGGLTRVALVRGSYVVNSSQGGGSKDTWVLEA